MPNQTNQGTKQKTTPAADFASTGSSDAEFQDQGSSTDELKEQASSVLAQAKSTAGEAYDTVAEKATTKIEEHKAGLSGGLTNVADSIRRAVDSLNGAAEPHYVTEYSAQYAQTAADKVERVARYFENTDLKGIARDTEDFARRNPALFLGGAFAVGILVARLLKSSPVGAAQSGEEGLDDVPYVGTGSSGRSETGLNAM